MSEFGWRDMAAMVAAGTTMAGLVIAWLHWQLGRFFASKDDVQALLRRMDDFASTEHVRAVVTRVDGIETQLRAVPSPGDVRAIETRLVLVERGLDVVTAKVTGTNQAIGRVEADMVLIKQHLLERGN